MSDGEVVAVVRFTNYLGNDGLNARILKGLPLRRNDKDPLRMNFKAASSTTHGHRLKTVFALKFANNEDADDFEMWWYAKNGSIKTWLEKEVKQEESEQGQEQEQENKLPLHETTNIISLTPNKAEAPSCNLKVIPEDSASNQAKASNDSDSIDDGDGSSYSDSDTSDSDEEKESTRCLTDYGDVPASQNWQIAFDF